MGSSAHGFVCHPTHKPTIQVCELEARSTGESDRRFHSGLVSNKGLCLSPLESTGSMPVPFEGTEFRKAVSGRTYMGNSAMEPCFTTPECTFPYVSPNGARDSQQGGLATPSPPPPPQVAGWLVLANVTRQWEFQAKLKTFSLPGVTRPLVLTSQPGVCDIAGVINNKLIPFLPLCMT